MRQLAAYLLAVLGGNNNPSVEDLKKIHEAGGVEFDEQRATQVINELKGKNVYEVMKAGSSKLATFGGSRGGSTVTTTTSITTAPVEEKKEEPQKEEKEEESASIGGLFGSDDD